MTTRERLCDDVVKAAVASFPRRLIDGREYRSGSICMWEVPALVDAVRRLERFDAGLPLDVPHVREVSR